MSETVERTEALLPGPAEALSVLLDVPMPADGLPPLWHWIYLLDRPAQCDLGPDGHPFRNTVPLPPSPGLRRMWAGGQVRVDGPLRFGESATRRTSVVAVQEKQGRTGQLVFVTVGHRISQGGRLVVDERQDLVYREPETARDSSGDSGAGDPPDEPVAQGEWAIEVTPPLLFRYSALTYNSHRIHYDREYARDVEGYPGLVVHGPLQALLMAELARARHGFDGPQTFEYRLRAPLFDHQGLVVAATPGADGTITSARDRSGRQTASGCLRIG